jgi:ligand-binding sensor domain-containing protein
LQTNGLDGTSVHSLAVSGTNLLAGADTGVFLSTNGGTSWSEVNTGLPRAAIVALAVWPPNLFAGTADYDGVLLSTNNGTSWASAGLDYTFVRSLTITGGILFAGSGTGVYVSTNNGTVWTYVPGPKEGYFLSTAASGYNLFAGNYEGVFLCTYNAGAWSAVLTALHSRMVALAVSGTKVFAGGIGVYRSTNNGTSWISADSGLTNRNVRCLLVSGSNLFAGTGGSGVFLSSNYGTTWTAVNDGLTNGDVLSLAVSGMNLFAGVLGSGVWRRPLSEMITSVEPAAGELPSKVGLSQNYPNPFNPSTTIKFELPKPSNVRLSVFDMLGREVSVLVNEKKEAGVHEVKFDASGLSSGVYFYRLTAGSFVQTLKLLLLR